MAQIRQYIGARYVFKIYENSQDSSSAEWEPNVTYEPLTIVTYLNSTYASKKDVPGSVGNPAANPQYWIVTGAYNGQIATLQAQIDEINNTKLPNINAAIQALTGKVAEKEPRQAYRKYILIFDSYGALGISTAAAQACPGGSHVLNVGGAAFCGAGGGQTWGQAFGEYVSGLTAEERAEFTDVMIFGGINDYGYTEEQIISAIADFNTTKNLYIPQCNVTLCPVSWATRADGTITAYVAKVISSYSLGSIYNNWRFVDGLNAFIHSDTYMESDGIHPTSAGIERLGKAIATFIKTGNKPKLTTSSKVATFEAANDGVSSTTLKTIISDDRVKLNGAIIISYTTPVTVNSGYTAALNLGKLSNTYFQGNVISGSPSNIVTVPAYIHNTVSGAWELKPVTIQVYYFYVFLSVEGGAITFDAIQTPLFDIESDLNMA